jgi:Ca2+-binding EF-hand superfamily protein
MSSKIPEQAPAAVPEEVQSSEEEFVDDNKQGEELDEAMQERLQEIFQLFDFDLDGHIQTVELGTIIRGLDFNLTEKQIMSLINKYDDTGSGKLNYPTFYNLMRDNQPMMSPITEEGVLESFKAFDIGGVHPGFIPAVDLVCMCVYV